MKTVNTKVSPFAKRFQYSVIALAMTAYASHAVAQDQHAHPQTAEAAEMNAEQQAGADTLLKVVRQATERYQDVAVAQKEGYALNFGCVSGDDLGAMGLHYINGNLVNSGILDPMHPQIIIYEPTANGGKKLIGADFLVIADQWNLTHSAPPELMGQLFHLFPSPNRFGLPAFYTLHVWAWKQNPKGAFTNWHPNVSCAPFAPGK
jgi:hypothetical protein